MFLMLLFLLHSSSLHIQSLSLELQLPTNDILIRRHVCVYKIKIHKSYATQTRERWTKWQRANICGKRTSSLNKKAIKSQVSIKLSQSPKKQTNSSTTRAKYETIYWPKTNNFLQNLSQLNSEKPLESKTYTEEKNPSFQDIRLSKKQSNPNLLFLN